MTFFGLVALVDTAPGKAGMMINPDGVPEIAQGIGFDAPGKAGMMINPDGRPARSA